VAFHKSGGGHGSLVEIVAFQESPPRVKEDRNIPLHGRQCVITMMRGVREATTPDAGSSGSPGSRRNSVDRRSGLPCVSMPFAALFTGTRCRYKLHFSDPSAISPRRMSERSPLDEEGV
jgi:hypothetical protein